MIKLYCENQQREILKHLLIQGLDETGEEAAAIEVETDYEEVEDLPRRLKREAHHSKSWSKGWSKGWKKGHHQKGDYEFLAEYPTQQCRDVYVDKCQAIAQPDLCQMIKVPYDVNVTETICQEICSETPAEDLSCNFDQFQCPDESGPGLEICLCIDCEDDTTEELEVCHQPGTIPECKVIDVERCIDDHQTICKECKQVPKTHKECKTVPKEECTMINKEVIKVVPEKVCEERCHETNEQQCRMEPYQECKDVDVEVEIDVPEEVCEW